MLGTESLLADARRLIARLKEHEKRADSLTEHAERLNVLMNSINQYRDETEVLQEISRVQPDALKKVESSQAGHFENLQIGRLQEENSDIRTLVAEQQQALELLMTRYRLSVCSALQRSHFDQSQFLASETDHSSNTITYLSQIGSAYEVMDKSAQLGEAGELELVRRERQLAVENEMLTNLVQNANSLVSAWPCQDAATNTDPSLALALGEHPHGRSGSSSSARLSTGGIGTRAEDTSEEQESQSNQNDTVPEQ